MPAFHPTDPIADTRTAPQLAAISRALYREGPLLLRTLQHWRPYICPFENLVGYVREGSRVLDIGCGFGLLFGLTAGVGIKFEGVGFDLSRQGIELATRMTSRAASIAPHAKLSFQRLDIGEAWPPGTFDVVFLVDVLHHVAPNSQEQFFRQVLSKVGPGGTLVYKDMCRSPWWRAQANRLQDLVIARQWIHYVPIQLVERWAANEGMHVVVREDMNRLWCGHELRVMTR
jgi:2-polyprenyl-3-methyl-5-hydroxy-6-metoxy-1,4-benzoquinol methylase